MSAAHDHLRRELAELIKDCEGAPENYVWLAVHIGCAALALGMTRVEPIVAEEKDAA